jgi:hypothetical protein
MIEMQTFSVLRGQILGRTAGLNALPIARVPDLIPIEQSAEGWFCLASDGAILHCDEGGDHRENINARAQAIAFIGKLIVAVPLATAFLPGIGDVGLCPSCEGLGKVKGLPDTLVGQVVCQCGGLGWIPLP